MADKKPSKKKPEHSYMWVVRNSATGKYMISSPASTTAASDSRQPQNPRTEYILRTRINRLRSA